MSSVEEFDRLAEIVCNGGTDGNMALADLEASSNADNLIQVFMQSQSDYSAIVAATHIVTWFKGNHKTMSPPQISTLITSLLEGVKRTCSRNDVTKAVIETSIHGLCKCVKLTYSDDAGCAVPIGDALLQIGREEQLGSDDTGFALKLLHETVKEFNFYDSKTQSYMNFAYHRRCSNNFRDANLLEIFRNVANILGKVGEDYPFIETVVSIVKEILTFDFMAIMVDETEEALSAQFPASWAPIMLDYDLLGMLWDQTQQLQGSLAIIMMQGLCGICGIRRSFFENVDDKINFLNFTLDRCARLPDASTDDGRLGNPEFCAAYAECLMRFVPPFGYKDLATSSSFQQWLDTAAGFTQQIFNIPFGSEGSFATTQSLINFWSRLTSSKRMYLSDEDRNDDLERYVPTIAVEYIKCRTTPQNFDTDEEVNEQILLQCEAFPPLLLLNTNDTVGMICENLNQVGQDILSSPGSMAWLFYIAGSSVNVLMANVSEQTAEMIANFIGIVTSIVVERATNGDSDLVELAALHYFKSVHSVFVQSRMNKHATDIVKHVFEDKAKLFNLIIQNMGSNMMRDAGDNPALVRNAIELVGDACRDAQSSLIRELKFSMDTVANLPLAQDTRTYKLRTPLFTTLWAIRLPDPFTMEHFTEFMAEIQNCMDATTSGNMTDTLFVAGWLRDLRGVASAAAQSQTAFSDFVDWVIDRADVFTTIATMENIAAPIVISLLRFVAELVTPSRHGRVNLPTSNHSASGVVLFKFVCEIIRCTLQNVINDDQIAAAQNNTAADGSYTMMLKPLMICMQAMKKCISGDFVPFGAMSLYQDDTYDVTVTGILQFLRIFPQYLFAHYPKSIHAAMDLLRTMVEWQVYSPLQHLSSDDLRGIIELTMNVASETETQTGTLLYALAYLSFVANLKPVTVRMQNGESTENIPSDRMSVSRTSRKIKELIGEKLIGQDDIWGSLIMTAMNIITTQDRGLSPCCSVVFPIFDAEPSLWQEFMQHFVSSYPPGKQPAVMGFLNELSDAASSEQKFFSEIFHFRSSIRAL